MNELIDTPLHRAIKRAFPQTNWPQTAIELLDKFVDGEVIEAKELKRDEMLIMFDLATAGLIECTRQPVFHNEQFAGFRNSFKYCSKLDYQGESKQKKKGAKYWSFWFLIGWAFGILAVVLTAFAIKQMDF